MMYNLSNICEYAKGKVDVSSLDETTYISTENMLPDKGGITKASSLPNVAQTQAFQKGDVLVSNIRPYFKKIWYAEFEGGCSNDVLVFRANNEVSSRFLFYVLADDSFFDYSMATSKGTKMPRGDKTAIMKYSVPSFPFQDQERIAGILDIIDRRIQINKDINDNLLQQLHLLYTNVFDESAMDIPLGEAINTASGGTPSRKHDEYYEDGFICWVKSKELLSRYIHDTEEHINELAVDKSSAKILPAHSVLIAMYGATVGAYGIISKPMTCNQAVCALLPNESYPYTYLFQFAHETQQQLINLAVGSAQQNISQVLIKQLPVHSDLEAIQKFHSIAHPIHEKIELLQAESLRLEALRDTLLPKLMSGELDVTNLSI